MPENLYLPLHANGNDIYNTENDNITEICVDGYSRKYDQELAERIVLAVNATMSMPTEELQSMPNDYLTVVYNAAKDLTDKAESNGTVQVTALQHLHAIIRTKTVLGFNPEEAITRLKELASKPSLIANEYRLELINLVNQLEIVVKGK